MAKHIMKSWKYLFQQMKSGHKTHDVRSIIDRNFNVGDTCELKEWDNETGKYTGDSIVVEITYITSKDHIPCALSSAVLSDSYAILSVKRK